MYYKILNKESELFKKLSELRNTEKQIESENEKAIEEKIGQKFTHFLGDAGQQHFRRVKQYIGFKFTEPEKVDLKIWKRDAEHTEYFIPNKKTLLGRKMHEFLLNGLQSSLYSTVWDILEVPHLHRFSFPFVCVKNEMVLVYLDHRHEPKSNADIIEITRSEFNSYFDDDK